MGANSSSSNETFRMSHELKRSEADIVNLMLPIFFTVEPVTSEDLDVARAGWNMILEDTSPTFYSINKKILKNILAV